MLYNYYSNWKLIIFLDLYRFFPKHFIHYFFYYYCKLHFNFELSSSHIMFINFYTFKNTENILKLICYLFTLTKPIREGKSIKGKYCS